MSLVEGRISCGGSRADKVCCLPDNQGHIPVLLASNRHYISATVFRSRYDIFGVQPRLYMDILL